ncbi:unnamed protein product, partial [Brassica napus]
LFLFLFILVCFIQICLFCHTKRETLFHYRYLLNYWGTHPYSEEIIRFDRADVKPLKPRK